MCGRFTLSLDPEELRQAFPWLKIEHPEDLTNQKLLPRYNIAPTQKAGVVTNDGHKKLEFFQWGLIPSWAKEAEIGSRLINARGETLAEKPAFRGAYRRRRCLVLADGFYEWKQEAGSSQKTPMYIHMASEQPFAFAGLWDIWKASQEKEEIFSFTIITTSPNALMMGIHQRMPVILLPEMYDAWLHPGDRSPQDLNPLLAAYPSGEMEAYPVSRMVNSPNNDRPECLLPAYPPTRLIPSTGETL